MLSGGDRDLYRHNNQATSNPRLQVRHTQIHKMYMYGVCLYYHAGCVDQFGLLLWENSDPRQTLICLLQAITPACILLDVKDLLHGVNLFETVCIMLTSMKPPPRQPSGTVLASIAGGPGFNPQSRTASYQRRFKNGTSSSLVQH